MTSVNSTNGLLIGVIYAVMCECAARISPFKHMILNGICNAFFVFGFFKRNEPIFNIQYELRLSEGIETIYPIESKDAPVTPPTGTPQNRVDVWFRPGTLSSLEMPMGGVCL